MTASGISPELIVPLGRTLLLGSSGYVIYQVVRGELDFEEAITGIVIGLVGITFFQDGFATLKALSDSLLAFITKYANHESLKEQIRAAIQNSEASTSGRLPSNGEFFSQLWRAGLWGAVSSVVELIFMLADVVIEASQKVFLDLILIFFPLGCGLFPVFPKILSNCILYSIELCLWRPMILLIHQVSSSVGREYMANDSTHGLKIMSVEIVAIILILSVPTITHKVMSGALAGDLGASGGLVKAGKKVYGSVVNLVGGFR